MWIVNAVSIPNSQFSILNSPLSPLPMNIFDLIILAVLVLLMLRGFMKGMVSQIVSVGSYFVCWIVASRFAFAVAPSIPAEEPWNRIGAMLLLFVGTMIVIRLIHRKIEKGMESMKIKEFDRQMGALLGLLKGVLICMVITFFAVMLTEQSRQSVFESKSGKYITFLITKTGAFIPEDACKLLKAQIALFDAEVNGTAAHASSTATVSNSHSAASTTSGFSLFARGAAWVDEAQKLREDLQKESNNASSLLDAIGKWWNGSSTPSTTAPSTSKAETEKKIESAVQSAAAFFSSPPTIPSAPAPSTPTAAVQKTVLKNELSSVAESIKPTTLASPADQTPILPSTPGVPSDEQLISKIASTATIPSQPQFSASTNEAVAIPTTVPLSSHRGRFLQRLTSGEAVRTPAQLLSTAKEGNSSKAATLFSPQQRPTSTQWDPKTWAKSLESTP